LKKYLVLALAALLLGTNAIAVFAEPVESYRGAVSADAPVTIDFSTGADDVGVIVAFKARNGGDRTLEVKDAGGAVVWSALIPHAIKTGSSFYVALDASSHYQVVISVSEGRTRYDLMINHCQAGTCS